MKTALIVLLIANMMPQISGQCSAIMVQLVGSTTCSATSSCATAAPGYFCFQGACCGVQMNCNPGQIAALSDPGMTPLPCSACPTGFSCVNSMCCKAEATGPAPGPAPSPGTSCTSTQVLVGGVCLNIVTIGATCAADAQCQGGSFCITGTCTCPNGFSNVNNVCTSTQTTSCSTGQVLVNGACLNTVGIGGTCTNQAQCPSGALCTNGVCTCPTGFSSVNGACVAGTACTTGQISVNGQCVAIATYGTICAFTQQCSYSNGACLNGICSCASGFSYNGADCSNACGAGSILVNNVCYIVVSYLGTCQVNQQCNYGFSQCISGICNCAPGYTYSGTFCVSTTATTAASITCPPTQVAVNNACYNTAQQGQACVVSGQCIGTPNLVCTNNICTVSTAAVNCLGNQVLINNVCYNLVNAGQTCSFSQQCLGGTTCVNNICGAATTATTCANGQVLFNGRCSSSIGNGCIDFPCISGGCSGVFPACRYSQAQNNYFCCQTNQATSPGPIVVVTQAPAANVPTCKLAGASVEVVGGAPKNCISGSGGQPCSTGFACEYNQGRGQYICCSTSVINTQQAVQGQMKMYPGSNSPLQCFTNVDCTSFPGFANCVLSARFNARVCCTTTSC